MSIDLPGPQMSQMFADFGISVLRVTLPLSVLAAVFAQAAPPNVKHFLPQGAQRGATAEVTAAGSFSTWPAKVWASDPGLQITCGDEKGKLNVTVADETSPGVYFIRLYDDEGASRPLPLVVGNLPEVAEKSSNNDSPAKAETLSSSIVTVNGRLEKRDDVDVYAVELGSGQTVVASVVANQTLDSPMDGALQVLSADGSVLAQNDDWHGLDPQLVFAAPSAGKYLVRIFAFPAQPDSRIGLAGGDNFLYRLTITTGPFVDYPWPLAVKQHDPGDVKLIGWNIAGPIERQTVNADARPFTLSGKQLAGQLSLAVEPHSCVIATDPKDRGEPQILELPTTVSGRLLQPSARGIFRFAARRGETILLELDGRDLGSPLDAVMEVLDSSGKSLVRADDTNRRRDPELSWKAPDDGIYQIVVSDLHGGGGERFFYRLRAIHAKPDFRIDSQGDAFVGSVGKPLEVMLQIVRQHGFDQEIVIKPEGLADSIIAEPVKSAKDGDSAKKVTLKLTATAPYSGPMRIVGVVQGSEKQSRPATFKAGGETEIADLWLTIKPDEQE